ncbi:hypothetical protein [Variovorax sp. DXTD-1]|uniref:hypothetical protein n=1 Tax=Variovorax sp. DXTD-1 TaxID=2495592 RepID=UPI000F87D6DD|nr:hypothetical protein [Variovorax sp. DXTD-1]RST54129.1 hypothetical protein EJI00_03105 [Variovorax sp. DXTD-1]
MQKSLYSAPTRRQLHKQELVADLELVDTHGWREGRNFRQRSPFASPAAEQNFLNEAARADRIVEYIAALKETTDREWRYEMAAGQDYADGARHFARLWEMQADLDPSGAIWRSVAPQGFAVPQPRVKGGAA